MKPKEMRLTPADELGLGPLHPVAGDAVGPVVRLIAIGANIEDFRVFGEDVVQTGLVGEDEVAIL